MAEMEVADKGNKGKKRSKKLSTRVDLTPMVDLAFLLITFFMLATTMNKPKTMEINKPVDEKDKDDKEEPTIKMSKTLNLMLGDNNKVYWYVSPDEITAGSGIELDSTDYSAQGLRAIVKRRQKEVQEMHGDKNELFVMIKPLPGSKNTVDALDEMTINGVTKYAILPPKEAIDSLVALQVHQKRK
ncbi:MAG TPA: biopolymer transporter ExbD [Saprospiraceae bacterium]|nr:biopolymer transporter ExbD [Saprospiraceae bacterium]